MFLYINPIYYDYVTLSMSYSFILNLYCIYIDLVLGWITVEHYKLS